MTDLMTAAQDAVFAALSAAVTGAPVYQHVPEKTQPPYIVVGDIEAGPGDGKGTDLLTIEIDFIHRSKGRRPMLAMMHAVREALQGMTLSHPEALFEPIHWISSAAVGADDGVTYAGIQQYEFEAEPA